MAFTSIIFSVFVPRWKQQCYEWCLRLFNIEKPQKNIQGFQFNRIRGPHSWPLRFKTGVALKPTDCYEATTGRQISFQWVHQCLWDVRRFWRLYSLYRGVMSYDRSLRLGQAESNFQEHGSERPAVFTENRKNLKKGPNILICKKS